MGEEKGVPLSSELAAIMVGAYLGTVSFLAQEGGCFSGVRSLFTFSVCRLPVGYDGGKVFGGEKAAEGQRFSFSYQFKSVSVPQDTVG